MIYMGSKARFAKEIIPIMEGFRRKDAAFVDLFCGGCNLVQYVTGKRVANDVNPYLMAMWTDLVSGRKFPEKIDRDMYAAARDEYNSGEEMLFDTAEIGWYGFMGSFNGRFFDGGYSGHSVSGRDYIGEQMRNTLKQVPFLKGVEFYNLDYERVPIEPGSVVYCDIPYKGTKQYDNSRNFDYDRFYNFARETSCHSTVFVSEYSMPRDFTCVWEKETKTALNQTKTLRAVEKLFILEN